MSGAATTLQAALVETLQASPALVELTGIYDGPPARAAFPYLSIQDGVALDWGTKTALGREVRLAVTVWDDGEEPARLHRLMAGVEAAVPDIERNLQGWRIASIIFARSIVSRDPSGPWAGLIEHRVRILQS